MWKKMLKSKFKSKESKKNKYRNNVVLKENETWCVLQDLSNLFYAYVLVNIMQ